MPGSFPIQFDYALPEAPFHFNMVAVVTVHHSVTYYVVNNFKLTDNQHNSTDALPEIHIRPVTNNGQRTWVHTDSQKETGLSMSVGKAIDEYSASLKKKQ